VCQRTKRACNSRSPTVTCPRLCLCMHVCVCVFFTPPAPLPSYCDPSLYLSLTLARSCSLSALIDMHPSLNIPERLLLARKAFPYPGSAPPSFPSPVAIDQGVSHSTHCTHCNTLQHTVSHLAEVDDLPIPWIRTTQLPFSHRIR